MPQPEPLVSIVIPVYNRAALVQRAISSALAQTYRSIEVIVCDNCSTDGTFAVIQEYMRRDSRVAGYRNSENLGPVKNWIRGIELSHGEYIRLLFSDDWIEPQAVEQMLKPLLEDPEIGFCYSSVEIHDGDRQYPMYRLNQEGRMDSTKFLHLLLNGSGRIPVSPGCGMFRRRDAIEFIPEQLPTFKGFDTNRRGIGNDVMLYLGTCARYPYCFHIAAPLTNFLSHPDSFSVGVSTGAPVLLDWCYINAFAYFLKQAALGSFVKLRLTLDLKYYAVRLRALELFARLAREIRELKRSE